MIKVELSKEEMIRCAQWGLQREEENKKRHNIADYDERRFNLTGTQANRLGVMTEFAIYKWLGYDPENIDLDVWAPFVPEADYGKYLGRPDIAGRYEIRRANNMASPIPIRAKDIKHNADIIQGYAYYTQKQPKETISVKRYVLLLGWVNAREAWSDATIPSWSSGSSRVTDSKRPMDELTAAVV